MRDPYSASSVLIGPLCSGLAVRCFEALGARPSRRKPSVLAEVFACFVQSNTHLRHLLEWTLVAFPAMTLLTVTCTSLYRSSIAEHQLDWLYRVAVCLTRTSVL